MSTLRYQSLKTNKNSLSIVLQSYPFIKKYTLKCGDILPNQGNTEDKFHLSGINNDELNNETSFITIKNSKYEFKIPYKGNFEFELDSISSYDQGYSAHKFLDRKIELINKFR